MGWINVWKSFSVISGCFQNSGPRSCFILKKHGAHCPGKSWNVLEFKFCPGMSWKVLEFVGIWNFVLECPGISWEILKSSMKLSLQVCFGLSIICCHPFCYHKFSDSNDNQLDNLVSMLIVRAGQEKLLTVANLFHWLSMLPLFSVWCGYYL